MTASLLSRIESSFGFENFVVLAGAHVIVMNSACVVFIKYPEC